MKLLFFAVFVLLACGAMGNIKRETLSANNFYRKNHGGKRLYWDTKVSKFAQNWCDYLATDDKFEHSKGSGYGENIYKSWSSSGSSSEGAGKSAVKSWYDEIKDYDFDKPGFSMETGHFTQVRIFSYYSLNENDKKISDGIIRISVSTSYHSNLRLFQRTI